MEKLGTWLRQTREGAGGTLKDAEEATHIRVRFLKMLEGGEFASFPGGEVQIRGFLRLYARYLDLPPDEVLARYNAETRGSREALSKVSADAQPASPPSTTQHSPRLSLEVLAIVSIALIAVLVVVVVAVYIVGQDAGGDGAATPTATLPSSAASSSPLAATAPAVTPTFPADPQGGLTLALEATEHVWVSVTTDGATAFEGMMAPQQIETWSGQEAIVVDTGNGAGLLVTVNGQLQGAMCGRGELCSRAWGPSGEMAVSSPVSTP